MRGRARKLQLLLVLIFALLLAGLYRLQVGEGESWARQAAVMPWRTLPVPPARGQIYDRYGRLLAGSRASLTLMLLRTDEQAVEAALAELLPLLAPRDPSARARQGESIRAAAARLRESGGLPYLRLVRPVPPELHARLLEHGPIPGVVLVQEPGRYYPMGVVAAHALGYVGPLGPAELAARPDWGPDALVGRAGLERQYDAVLQGEPGRRRIRVDATGRIWGLADEQPPRSGADLRLELDARLQATAEQVLARHLEWVLAQGEEGVKPHGAAAVVLEVQSGAVRALVSLPAYDPNGFARGLTAAEWERLALDPDQPLRNRALSAYPPGSIYKMVTALAALSAGATAPDEPVVCTGRYWALHRPRDWKEEGHGQVRMTEGIAQSCDVYFYELGRRIGPDAIHRTAVLLGMGAPTGIDLPEESPGFSPDKAAYGSQWFPGEVLSIAIGQGRVLTTPVQMAAYGATLATGHRVVPQLLAAVRPAGGTWLVRAAAAPVPVPIPEVHLEAVRAGMAAATVSPGTAAGAFWAFPVPAAAKTGTAEAPQGDVAWAVAYAPYDQPRYAVAVVVPGGGHGSWSARAARNLLAGSLDVEDTGPPGYFPWHAAGRPAEGSAASDAGADAGQTE